MPNFCIKPSILGVLSSVAAIFSIAMPSVASSGMIDIPKIVRPAEETSQWWFRAGAAQAAQLVKDSQNKPMQAKNVIVFLGDGMGLPTIAAARIFAGQRLGVDGESYRLSFEKFPYTALSRTYETNQQTADSAGTMTAIMSGVKTKSRFIGIGQKALHRDCASTKGQSLVSALELAKAAGLAVGVVTTTTITHATPAATYGHSPERNWEADKDMPALALEQGCQDLAQQFVKMPIGQGIDIALGGGRAAFMPERLQDPVYPEKFGVRRDGRNLLAEWQSRYPQGQYIWSAEQLKTLSATASSHVLGLFNPSHLQYGYERQKNNLNEPSLADMTRAALTFLSRKKKGFFLVVEGGKIDHALHEGNAYRALDETVALSDAVQVALEMTSEKETLIIVTADHSHSLSLSGYAQRGNPILGLVHDKEGSDSLARDALGLPYTTLNFANGPGYTGASAQQVEGSKHFPHTPSEQKAAIQGRPNLENVDTTHADYMQEAMVPLRKETHGGEDVAIFANGPGAVSFHGQIEQNVIFHLIVQHHRPLRKVLCALDICNKEGIPIDLPDYQKFLQRYSQ